MMHDLLSDAMTDLRRPLRLRGPTSRRAFAGIALVTGAVLLLLIGVGLLLAEPVGLPAPVETDNRLPLDPLRDRIVPVFQAMPGVIRILLVAATVPLLFAMVRRSTDVGIPRFLSVLGVLVLVVSTISIMSALDERVGFPLTTTVWDALTADAEDISAMVGIGIVASPVLLMTLIGDLLIILLVGLVALAGLLLSLLTAVIIACLPSYRGGANP